ncbi:hypothetical protein GYMLUDRAFT_159376 [Collybiopsis luxurians FD-317 M1]|nr:hypothetical protein GYMLUDRAFT_159376 [Collybiopsis luxurians FD-317 M1]
MSTITDVSSVLSEYMLKGWVLTDELCRNSKCNVPLMRSPKGQNPVVHFCANCDGGPLKGNGYFCLSQHSDSPSASSTYSGSQRHTISRSSTPATEVSDASSSDGFQLPPETPESRRRREQSDFASTQIGQRLLKGWALLAEECLNENCFAVPLVRPPKTAGGEKDPRKASCRLHDTVLLCLILYAGVRTLRSNLHQRRRSCRRRTSCVIFPSSNIPGIPSGHEISRCVSVRCGYHCKATNACIGLYSFVHRVQRFLIKHCRRSKLYIAV